MASIDYRETELWRQATALLTETYRLTTGWPEEGRDLAKDIRSSVRLIVRTVPGAFKKGGITGNVQLQMSSAHFGELEALSVAAEALGIVNPKALQPLIELSDPIRAKFAELAKEAKLHAKEIMKKRTRLFGSDEDDDDF